MNVSSRTLFVAAVVTLFACGCSTIPRMPDDRALITPQGEYYIGAGDGLSIKLFYTPELNEDVMVRPDGRISLQLVGDVQVAGRTPDEVTKELRERYAGYLAQPDVAVILRSFGSQKAFVGGEVKNPAMISIDGHTNLTNAVFQTGGLMDTAEPSSVILLRRGPNGREAYRVDLSGALDGEEDVPVLRPYDVVYVPKSFIAKVGMYVDLYINRIMPKNASFTAFYQINPVVTDIPEAAAVGR